MVNTGHPSRACKLCRTRRIKCDETKPHCLKCKKTNRQCPGYRDAFDINLRDETQRTIRKAKAAKATATAQSHVKKTSPAGSPNHQRGSPSTDRGGGRSSPQASESSWETQSSSSSSPTLTLAAAKKNSQSPMSTFALSAAGFVDTRFDFNTACSQPQAFPPSPVERLVQGIKSSFEGTTVRYGAGQYRLEASDTPQLLPSLQTPLDEQATCYLLSNFVLTLSGDQGNCLFNFVLNILNWDGVKETPFPMAFTAVSLAAFAGRPNSRHLLPQSRLYYSTALVQLKEAIKDKDRAKHDTSLAAAILLSFYEARPL